MSPGHLGYSPVTTLLTCSRVQMIQFLQASVVLSHGQDLQQSQDYFQDSSSQNGKTFQHSEPPLKIFIFFINTCEIFPLVMSDKEKFRLELIRGFMCYFDVVVSLLDEFGPLQMKMIILFVHICCQLAYNNQEFQIDLPSLWGDHKKGS